LTELIELCLVLVLAVALVAAAKGIPIPLPLFFILEGVVFTIAASGK